ncbi:hypothetical protein [Thermobifida cellulosilytica]|uniref:Uncharacterized protein n=1 Tax=Thermobifida cellulosilytica TB100 TaxID=665004 RepID=A0A147KGF7_THECS|nr:hypothetical protein [Thermobifida cellulosilytica]KUP96404.1 hypothetical protein AC529_12360 [Thermobifida cellulosilytica TB100]
MSETQPDGLPAGMGPEDYEFWDDATRTYYERQDDGAIIARPYNGAENQQADAAANRALLIERLKGMTLLLPGDMSSNNTYTALSGISEEELRAQVGALTAQSNRQADMLATVTRLILGRFESLTIDVQ